MTTTRYTLRVTPKASANRIVEETATDGTLRLRVYVTAVPENGKANAAVIALLATHLGVPKTAITISRGASGRDKTVIVDHG